jgi:hypothetical protein
MKLNSRFEPIDTSFVDELLDKVQMRSHFLKMSKVDESLIGEMRSAI